MSPRTGDGQSRQRSPTPRQLISAVLIVLGVWFVLVNTRSTTIRFFVPEVTAPLWIVLVATIVVGVVIGKLLDRRS